MRHDFSLRNDSNPGWDNNVGERIIKLVDECDQWRKNCFNDSGGFQRKQQRELVNAAKRNNKKEEKGIVKNQVVGL